MKKHLFIFLLSICFLKANAQYHDLSNVPQFNGLNGTPTATSPTASGLGYYIQFPVANSTGVADISIPLGTVSDGGLRLSLNLSYHASGVHVDQLASWVGMNWSLNAGGVIVRAVNDFPDDERIEWVQETFPGDGRYGTEMYGWIEGNYKFNIFPNYTYNYGSNSNYCYSPLYPCGEAFNASNYFAHNSAMGRGHHYDNEPDNFFVNAGPLQFRFVFDQEGQPHIVGKNSNLKVEPYPVHIPGTRVRPIEYFTITDEEGTVYTFTEKEKTTHTMVFRGDFYTGYKFLDRKTKRNTYTSSWYLTAVKSPKGDEKLTFRYTNTSYTMPVPRTHRRGTCLSNINCDKAYEGDDESLPDDVLDSTPENPPADNEWDSRSSPMRDFIVSNFNTIYGKVLERISSKTIAVNFITENRLDLIGDKNLKKIEFLDLSTNTLLSGIQFNYVYKESSSVYPLTNNQKGKRLFLSSVQELAGNNLNDKPPYVFTYDEGILPPRFSSKQDFWGYFNDNTSNGSMIPSLYVYPDLTGADRYRIYPLPSSYSGRKHFLPGMDRTVNAGVIQYGTLKQIKYPTGGSSTYTYETNKCYDNLAGQEYTAGGIRISKVDFYEPESNKTITKTYSYKSNGVSSGVLISQPTHATEITQGPNPKRTWIVDYIYDNNPENWLSLPFSLNQNNHYKASDYYTDAEMWNIFTLRFSNSLTPLTDEYGANVRYTNVSINQSDKGKTEYVYAKPKNYRDNATFVKTSEWYSRIPNTYEEGFPNFETKLEDREWGYIQKTGYNVYPYPKMSDSDGLNNELLSIMNYDKNGKILNKEEFIYTRLNKQKYGSAPFKIKALNYDLSYAFSKSFSYITANGNTTARTQGRSTAPYSYGFYNINTETENVVSQIKKTVYGTADNSFVETSQSFQYGGEHAHPIKQSMTNSDGTVKNVYTRFPQDYNTTVNWQWIANLKFANIHRVAIETVSTVEKGGNEIVTGGMFNNYNAAGINTESYALELDNLIPVNNFTFSHTAVNKDTRYVRKYHIVSFDLFDNMKEVQKEYDQVDSYIWGYTDYPSGIHHADSPRKLIAKVDNANHNEVAYTSFESGKDEGNWHFDAVYIEPVQVIGAEGIWRDADYYRNERWIEYNKTGGLSFSGAVHSNTLPVGNYKVSFWAKVIDNPTASLGVHINNAFVPVPVAGEWKYYEYTLPNFSGIININCDFQDITNVIPYRNPKVLIDELRLHPVDAQMTSYTYKSEIGLSSMTSPQHYTTSYIYDHYNRLRLVKDGDGNIIKRYLYHYKH